MFHWTIYNKDKSHLHWGRHWQPALNCSSVWNFLNGILKCFLNNLKSSSVQGWLGLSKTGVTILQSNKKWRKTRLPGKTKTKQSYNCTQWIQITWNFLSLVQNPVDKHICVCMCIYMHIHMCIYIHTYSYIYTCTHVYTQTHIISHLFHYRIPA